MTNEAANQPVFHVADDKWYCTHPEQRETGSVGEPFREAQTCGHDECRPLGPQKLLSEAADARAAIVSALVSAFGGDGAASAAMLIFLDTDGHNSIRPLTYGEIADVLARWVSVGCTAVTSTSMAANGITSDMVMTVAYALSSSFHAKYSLDDMRVVAQRVLSAGLAGCTVVTLPAPDVRTARALVQYWNGNPETLPQEERFALQRLADIREARRLASSPGR